jgi:hypothetical protein
MIPIYETMLSPIVRRALPCVVFVIAAALSGCPLVGEWDSIKLVNPTTGQTTGCIKDWGSHLPPEEIQRLHQCIDACAAHGFQVVSPNSVPPAVPPVAPSRFSYIPSLCRDITTG